MALIARMSQSDFILGILLILPGIYAYPHHQTWDDYKRDWDNKIDYQAYSKKMYPFLEFFGDLDKTQASASNGFDAGINFQFPFFGHEYQSLWVSKDGHVVPSKGIPAIPSFFMMVRWPNVFYPESPDPPFIAPFYAAFDFKYGRFGETSRLYYRALDSTAIPGQAITKGMLNHISEDVRNAVVGADNFIATHGFVLTWSKVVFSGCGSTCNNGQGPRNTIQLAVVTDQVNTYSVFNFYNVSWVGSTDTDCDPKTGRTSTNYPNCKAAQVGFNAGRGKEFKELPFSYTDRIVDIDTMSGSNVQGRFFYKISDEIVVRGGCMEQGEAGSNEWPLEIYPKHGSMFGGHVVNVSGPCFKNEHIIKCKFGQITTGGTWNKDNRMRAECIAPPLFEKGQIDLSLSIDGGTTYPYKTKYTVVAPDLLTPGIILEPRDEWLKQDAAKLTVKWTPRDLSFSLATLVDVKLMGFREEGSTTTWDDLHTLSQSTMSNTGTWEFQPQNHRCSGKKCDYRTGAIQVSIRENQDPANSRRIWSEVIPLGWYTTDAQQNWPSNKCLLWFGDDSRNMVWRQGLSACPCTLQQAYVDFGRWQADTNCNIHDNPETNCQFFHPGAVHCVRSVHATSEHGSGNQCCYDNERGNLMYSQDSVGGSTPDRSHPWGRAPYGLAGRVPILSHWQDDVSPYFYCCKWSPYQKDCFKFFMERRPTSDCKTYERPGLAVAYGDPHFTTFDGTTYSFNGKGEFTLLLAEKADMTPNVKFHLQARFETPPVQTWGQPMGTRMTSLAMFDAGSTGLPAVVIEVDNDKIQSLRVYVNSVLQSFDSKELRWQDYGTQADVSIINAWTGATSKQDNMTVIFKNGIGVNVANKNGYLHVMASVPPLYKNYVSGLFGKWDDFADNDLMPPQGPPAVRADQPQQVFDKFGWAWNVKKPDSKLPYRSQLNYEYYNNKTHIPPFQPPSTNNTIPDSQINQVCRGSQQCIYDYKTTRDVKVAMASRDTQAWFGHMLELSKPVNSCGWIPVPYSVKEAANPQYTVGSTVNIKDCIEGYTLEGHTSYECRSEADLSAVWYPVVSAKCNEIGGGSNNLAAAIAVPIILIILIAIIVVAAFMIYKRRKQSNQQPRAKPETVEDGHGNVVPQRPKVLPQQVLTTQRPPRPPKSGSRTPSSAGTPNQLTPDLNKNRLQFAYDGPERDLDSKPYNPKGTSVDDIHIQTTPDRYQNVAPDVVRRSDEPTPPMPRQDYPRRGDNYAYDQGEEPTRDTGVYSYPKPRVQRGVPNFAYQGTGNDTTV